MKICWDNLERHKIYLSKKGNFRSEKDNRTYYPTVCEMCGDDCLSRNKDKFCTAECFKLSDVHKENIETLRIMNTGRKHTKESKKKMSDAVKGRKHSEETKKKLSIIGTGRKHTEEAKQKIREKRKLQVITEEHKKKLREKRLGKKLSDEIKEKISKSKKGVKIVTWKTKYYKDEIPLYDTYSSQIDWCEECRRNTEDENILEVKCSYCGKWFIPNSNKVNNRLQYLKGNEKYEGEFRFYCSEGCSKACPIYGKRTKTLMKEDAIRAGRLNWLELNREIQPQIRQMVLKRDEYTCQKCSSIDELHCHHIYPVATDPLLSADIDNCITLCVECHKEVHQQDGCKYGQLSICYE